jgi:CheY-like chemotaxis protein
MAKLRVLIVDDDDMVRAQLGELLRAQHHEVFELPSAIGVTRAVMHSHIDVVVIDIQMPALPGDKLAHVLRENPRFKHLGVVLISGRPAEELDKLAVEVGADAVVTKSEARAKFTAAVESAARYRAMRAH